jgi:hypothetical protein
LKEYTTTLLKKGNIRQIFCGEYNTEKKFLQTITVEGEGGVI